ncbi:MAG: GH3 auxin-responsive promoter family protein [Gemmataceae bacterium]|nr:GH3 auxin-responsive promoter family protein [Gemmataceae bacterium]
MSAAGWLNSAWMLKCAPERVVFEWACRHVEQTQERILTDILRANRDTVFGMTHHFDGITNARTYQKRVPPAVYEDFAEPIRRVAEGEPNVLTREPVTLLEPTSGTTGGEKLIPYTAGLRRQFQRGVAAWIADLYYHRPELRRGRAYWSISPALGPPRRSAGGIPIGFADDAAYLGRVEQFALGKLLAVPAAIARLSDLTSLRYCTLRYLLAADDLTLISVWSPTFLTALLAPLPEWCDRLCDDVCDGKLRPPGPHSGPYDTAFNGRDRSHECAIADLDRRLQPDPKRARHLTTIWQSNASLAEKLHRTWPRLALISCWTDAGAARYVPELRQLFPHVEIQPKGLLATEGFVSFPLIAHPGAALALRSHFFEFEEADAKEVRLAHELASGGRYRVLLTTAGGLYRYQLRDEIEVVGFHHQCPLLRFLGKADQTSDLVGEKLAEPHVRAVLDRLPSMRELAPRFALMVPIVESPPHYRLYVQGVGIIGGSSLHLSLQAELQAALEENLYYRHAVAIGQLGAVEVSVLDSEAVPGWSLYERECVARGQKCGAIKPLALDRRTDWPAVFEPYTLASTSVRR